MKPMINSVHLIISSVNISAKSTYTGNVNPDILSYFVRVTAVDTEKVRHRKKYGFFCRMRYTLYIIHGFEISYISWLTGMCCILRKITVKVYDKICLFIYVNSVWIEHRKEKKHLFFFNKDLVGFELGTVSYKTVALTIRLLKHIWKLINVGDSNHTTDKNLHKMSYYILQKIWSENW